jgi:hypothetical protein
MKRIGRIVGLTIVMLLALLGGAFGAFQAARQVFGAEPAVRTLGVERGQDPCVAPPLSFPAARQIC